MVVLVLIFNVAICQPGIVCDALLQWLMNLIGTNMVCNSAELKFHAGAASSEDEGIQILGMYL